MKFHPFLGALCAACLVSMAGAAEPTRIIAAYPPGASLDHVARVFAQQVRVIAGETAVVENKPGANGTIGAQSVAQAAADGKTLLLTPETIVTVNPFLYRNSKFDVNTLIPMGMLAFQSSALVVRADSDVRTLQDFLALAKRQEINYASGGHGSTGHLVMSHLAAVSDIKTVQVPYRGGAAAVMAVLSGEVKAAFLALGNVMPHIQQGKLIGLAVSSSARLAQLPDVPTVAESGFKDFVIHNGIMLMAPKGLPASTKAELAEKIRRVGESVAFKQALAKVGMEATYLDPVQTAARLEVERRRWQVLIEKSGIKVQ